MIDDVRAPDEVMAALGRATAQDLDASAAERIRARCHRALGAGPGPAREDAVSRSPRRLVEPVLVTASCVVYLAEVVRRALHLLGL